MKEITMHVVSYSQALTYILENVTDLPEPVREKLEMLHTQITKKKPTKKQEANVELANQLYALMLEKTGRHTVTEWMAFGEPFSEISNQKVSALMRVLEKAGKVVKSAEKRKSYFEAVLVSEEAVSELEPENEGD